MGPGYLSIPPTSPAQQESSFDGATFDPTLDGKRLTTQLRRVRDFMLQTSAWWNLHDLSLALGDPQASVSARLRDLRKERFGKFNLERRRSRTATEFWERAPQPSHLFENKMAEACASRIGAQT